MEMKATHRHRDGYSDRVYHLTSDGKVFVKIGDFQWIVSVWSYDPAFYYEMVEINKFKGNK